MKTILVTGIGGLTPRSITGIIRENHPDYKIIGCDIEKKAVGFFMKGLLDEYYVCPRCTSSEYFPWMEKLIAEKHIDYAFVQPEALWNGEIIMKRTVSSLVLHLWVANCYLFR